MPDAIPSFLLVDGNNIIHTRPELARLYRKQRRSAYSELIKTLEKYQDFSDDRVVVVFDGIGQRTNETREPGSVQIFYSSESASADSIIERLAATNASKYRIVVATNDIPVQDAVVAAGGEAISVDGMFELIERSDQELSRFLKARRDRIWSIFFALFFPQHPNLVGVNLS